MEVVYRSLVVYTAVFLCLLRELNTGGRGDFTAYLYKSSGLPEGSTVARAPVEQWVVLWDSVGLLYYRRYRAGSTAFGGFPQAT